MTPNPISLQTFSQQQDVSLKSAASMRRQWTVGASMDPASVGGCDEIGSPAANLEPGDASVSALTEALSALRQESNAYRQSIEREYGAILARVISDCVPQISYASAAGALSEVFCDLESCEARGHVEIRAHESFVEQLRTLLEDIAEQSDYTLIPDESVVEGSVHAKWNSGGVRCDPGKAIQFVIELLNQALPAHVNDGAQQ